MRKSEQLHLDPGKMAVMVVSASFELHSPPVLKVAAQHPQDPPWEAEMRRPSPDHKKADSLKCLRQAQYQGHSPIDPLLLLFH